MKTFEYTLTDPHGLHARPAAMLVKTAAGLASQITVTAPTGSADGKRLMALMRLGAGQGMTLTFILEGPDEAEAAELLLAFLKENL